MQKNDDQSQQPRHTLDATGSFLKLRFNPPRQKQSGQEEQADYAELYKDNGSTEITPRELAVLGKESDDLSQSWAPELVVGSIQTLGNRSSCVNYSRGALHLPSLGP